MYYGKIVSRPMAAKKPAKPKAAPKSKKLAAKRMESGRNDDARNGYKSEGSAR